MESEDAVVLLSAAPATAYREYLYRPGGRLARWIDDRFDVLATPGHPSREAARAGDVLLEVRLGRADRGRCVTLGAAQAGRELFEHGLPPGHMLLRPRRLAQLTEPQPVEPVAASPDAGTPVLNPWPGDAEHDFSDDTGAGIPVRHDVAAAVAPFTSTERARVAEPLLSARASAEAVAWTHRMHPAVSGVNPDDIRAALRDYIDAAAVQAAIERHNRRERRDPLDAANPESDAALVECVHQFQMKCYRDRREHDGRAGESTLDSLGLVVRAGSGFRAADRGNAAAQRRLRGHDQQIGALTEHEFSAANWFDAMADPSVFGWRTKLGNGLHVLLIRRLRQAERHLLTLPAYRGMTPAAMGVALGITEAQGGARPSQSTSLSVHTFGLAIDIAYRANPWIRDATSWLALRHAAALVSGIQLTQATASEYFSALGSAGRSTDQIWEELERRNNELITYFRLSGDAPALRAALGAGQMRGTSGLFAPQESIDQAADRWHARIQQDRDSLARTDFGNHAKPDEGFLSLPRDLVIALRDHACLAWGAVDLGPGSRGSGDMMHFDARIGGVGQVLARGVSFVPAAGHPCLSAASPPAQAEARSDVASEEVAEHLGGQLWTFIPETYGLPVAIYCPRATMSRETVEVLVFAHGLLRGCARLTHLPAGFVTDPPFALGSVVHASGRPMVLVVPLLDWARPGGEHAFGRGHERWHALGRPDRLNALIGEVLAEVARVRGTAAPSASNLLVAGHSRAYDFLEPLAASRQQDAMQRGALAKLSRVWAFDTTYAGRVANWVDWVSVNPHLLVHVFYRPDSPTALVGEAFHRRRRPGLAVTPVREQHCDLPATRLRALLGEPAAEAVEGSGTASPPSAEELTSRLARCIGIWETNRGRDNPAPRESTLETVAGVHASMATIEQATMPYAITVLRRHRALRGRARPPLTLTELDAANARVSAVATLLKAVTAASIHGTAPDDFIAGNRPAITATGLNDDDVRTMFRAETLEGTLRQARAAVDAAGRAAVDRAAAERRTSREQATAAQAARHASLAASLSAIPDRLGLDEGSLRAYVNKPKNWGEHRAGWQRRAVAAMPHDIGQRIEAVAVSDNGTALAIPTIRSRVDAELNSVPQPSTEDIVRTVAQQNNPHEADYGRHVWQTYLRLYP